METPAWSSATAASQGGPATALASPPSDYTRVGRCILDRLSGVGTEVKSSPVAAWAKAGKLGEYPVGATMVAGRESNTVCVCSVPRQADCVVKCSV